MKKSLVMSFVLTWAVLFACGPMNHKPASSLTPSSDQDSPLVGPSANGLLYIYGVVQNSDDPTDPEPDPSPSADPTPFPWPSPSPSSLSMNAGHGHHKKKRPKVGDNLFILRVLRADTLAPVSDQTKVHVTYFRAPSSPRKIELDAVHQNDGTISFPIRFKRVGTYEVQLRITDGDLQDDYAFEIKL